MRAITILYGGSLTEEAFKPVFSGQSAVSLAIKKAAAFPYSDRTLLFAKDSQAGDIPVLELLGNKAFMVIRREWTVSELLLTMSELSAGFDFAYYAWADAPFLDPALAGRIAERHTRYAAEYSFADGWPAGLSPELVTSASAGILYKIAGDAGAGPVRRDSIFTVLQKDINSFDIETEISEEDLRHHRLSFFADSKRNLLLLERFASVLPAAAGTADTAGVSDASGIAGDICKIIKSHPQFLRTLPAFFPIQITSACPKDKGGSCRICPYPQFGINNGDSSQRDEFMAIADFSALLDKIEQFAGDGIIDLSFWGEISLHPQREILIKAVMERPALSLIIETSGIGWADFDFAKIAGKLAANKAYPRKPASATDNTLAVSWIVSLNPADLPDSNNEAVSFVKKAISFFPQEKGNKAMVYVEAVRLAGEEDAIEKFYRAWKAFGAENNNAGPAVIIQKYDSFCGFLPKKNTVDLSPVERRPCWHLLRDFPVLLDGIVPMCREDLGKTPVQLGNVFNEDLAEIWKRGEAPYLSHCRKEYGEICRACDEYYTFNF